jgi:hypothetical protein
MVRLRLEVAAVYGVHSAEVVGDMTGWAPMEMPFDGDRFAVEVDVPPGGRWHYRFRVDGRWMNDPDADDFEPWLDGGVVSIRHT